jgi:hypothetical protein
MSLDTFSIWLDTTPVSEALKASGVIIPLAQSLHILSVAFVFSGAALLAARSFGLWGTRAGLADWAAPLVARQWLALILLLLTGALLIVAEPTRELVNPVLQIKLVLVLLTVPLSLLLARRQQAGAGGDAAGPRGLALAVLALWVLIIFAGRWIAYI